MSTNVKVFPTILLEISTRRRMAITPIQKSAGVRESASADELVEIPQCESNGCDAQRPQEKIGPSGPGAALLGQWVDQEREGKDEPHVHHPEEIGFDRNDGAVEGPPHEGEEKNRNDPAELFHACSAILKPHLGWFSEQV